MEERVLKDIGLCKNKILSALLNSTDFCELMLRTTDYTEDDIDNMLYTQVFPYLFVNETQKEIIPYTCIEIDIPRVPTGTIKDMKITIWCYPFKLFSLMSDGVIETAAQYPEKIVVKATEDGSITLPELKNKKIVAGTVFVFAKDDFGGEMIEGNYEDGSKKFTATSTEKIKAETEYEVGYIVAKESGVQKISFNDKKLPKAYYITMDTVEKDEDEVLTPYKIILYKAQPQRNFELSQSSEGDPVSITLTFDLLVAKDGNFVDMVEITDEAE